MRRLGAILGLVWAVSLLGLTAQRVAVWDNDLTLWTDATRRGLFGATRKPRPWINLGLARYGAGDFVGADAAVRIGWHLAEARPGPEGRQGVAIAAANLGYIAWARGKATDARTWARWVRAVHPEWPQGETLCRAVSC